MAEDARKAALQDGQDAGTAVIYAEAKLGELLANRPRNYQSSGRGTLKETPLPSGISKADFPPGANHSKQSGEGRSR